MCHSFHRRAEVDALNAANLKRFPEFGLAELHMDPCAVVGVVREMRFENLTGRSDAIGAAYFPPAQAPRLRRLRWIAVKSTNESGDVTRAIRSALIAVDPVLLGIVAVLTGVVALLACLSPAYRAAKVDPLNVLTEQ